MAEGVRLGSGYIELGVKYKGALDDIRRDIKSFEDQAQESGVKAGKSLKDSVEGFGATVKKEMSEARQETKETAKTWEEFTLAAQKANKLEEDLAAVRAKFFTENKGRYLEEKNMTAEQAKGLADIKKLTEDVAAAREKAAKAFIADQQAVKNATSGAGAGGGFFDKIEPAWDRAMTSIKSKAHTFGTDLGNVLHNGVKLGIQGIEWGFSKLWDMVKSGAQWAMVGVAGAITAAFGATFYGGVKLLDQLDVTRIKLKQFGASQQEVNMILEEAHRLASSTGVAYEQMATVAQNLWTHGITDPANMDRMLQMTADLAAMTGQSPEAAAGTMLQMAQGTRERITYQLQSWDQAGFPIYKMLAELKGVNEATIRKMVTDHEIGWSEIAQVIETKLHGVSNELNMTFGAQLKNVWQNLQELGAAALEPLFGGMRGGLTSLNAWIEGWISWVQQHQPAIVAGVRGIGDAFLDFGAYTLRWAKDFMGGLAKVLGGLASIADFLHQHEAADALRGAQNTIENTTMPWLENEAKKLEATKQKWDDYLTGIENAVKLRQALNVANEDGSRLQGQLEYTDQGLEVKGITPENVEQYRSQLRELNIQLNDMGNGKFTVTPLTAEASNRIDDLLRYAGMKEINLPVGLSGLPGVTKDLNDLVAKWDKRVITITVDAKLPGVPGSAGAPGPTSGSYDPKGTRPGWPFGVGDWLYDVFLGGGAGASIKPNTSPVTGKHTGSHFRSNAGQAGPTSFLDGITEGEFMVVPIAADAQPAAEGMGKFRKSEEDSPIPLTLDPDLDKAEKAIKDWVKNLDPLQFQMAFGMGGMMGMGGVGGSAGMGLKSVEALAPGFGVSLGSGLRPGDRGSSGNLSYHNSGNARDFNAPGNDPATLSNFASYLMQSYGPSLNELIYRNPVTKQTFGVLNGKAHDFGESLWSQHEDHVHVAIAGNLGGGMPAMSGGANWDAIAQKESGGQWNLPYGDRDSTGGLQIRQGTWNDFGGQEFAPSPYMASKEQQIIVAERILAKQGPQAWAGGANFVPASGMSTFGPRPLSPGTPAPPPPGPGAPAVPVPSGPYTPPIPGQVAPDDSKTPKTYDDNPYTSQFVPYSAYMTHPYITPDEAQSLRDLDDRIKNLQAQKDIKQQQLDAAIKEGKADRETILNMQREAAELDEEIARTKEDFGLKQQQAIESPLPKKGKKGHGIWDKTLGEFVQGMIPDVGQLGDIGMNAMTESFLPPGFSNPFDWGIMQAGSGVLNFLGGLIYPMNPIAGSLLLAGGGAMGGSGSGMAQGIMGMIPYPFGTLEWSEDQQQGMVPAGQSFVPPAVGENVPHLQPGQPATPGPGNQGGVVNNFTTNVNGDKNAVVTDTTRKIQDKDAPIARRYMSGMPR